LIEKCNLSPHANLPHMPRYPSGYDHRYNWTQSQSALQKFLQLGIIHDPEKINLICCSCKVVILIIPVINPNERSIEIPIDKSS